MSQRPPLGFYTRALAQASAAGSPISPGGPAPQNQNSRTSPAANGSAEQDSFRQEQIYMTTTEPTEAEVQAAKDAEHQRQQALHAHRVNTADRKRHRKIAERSRKANR